MNKFANIIEAITFDKVKYYTVHFEDKELNEFEDFLDSNREGKANDELKILLSWLKNIGNKYSAKKHFFRNENKADALPPPRRYLTDLYEEHLRLYCMRINDNIVILFNGGVKTAATAQECPNVKKYFNMANKLARRIDDMIVRKSIIIKDRELLIEEEIEI